MKTTILVACHKPYVTPEQPCYVPIQVGAALNRQDIDGMIRDDTGDNISEKNRSFCELTALYWAWKNLDSDAIGLVHYRRYFARRCLSSDKQKRIARPEDYERLLAGYPVILPPLRHYWIETNYSQYVHAHHEQDLAVTRQIISELYPEYIPAYDKWMEQTYGHHFNMFVMKKPWFDAYCQWLFSILFELEKRLDISEYDEYNKRVFGFVGERLMDCWLETNNILYAEMPVVFMEKRHWPGKIYRFLKRKLTGSSELVCQIKSRKQRG